MWPQLIEGMILSILVGTAIIFVGHVFERNAPAKVCGNSSLAFNLKYMFPYYGLRALFGPFASAAVVLAVNALGGGLIKLPEAGIGPIWSVTLYAIAADFFESAFHLAQHKLPALWKMHSLHHTDRELNVSTAIRHFWAEEILKYITIYAGIGLLFRANPTILTAYAILSFYNFYLHMNVKGGLGRFSWIINTPQYHRLHHSRRQEDYNLRYAAIFPLFDVACGTYRQPEKDDYPDTGLEDNGGPRSLSDAIFWPLKQVE
jgi:sterol desaturase/sphingolipid hydroxylase (fatty acid hydroxylase superfamily)